MALEHPPPLPLDDENISVPHRRKKIDAIVITDTGKAAEDQARDVAESKLTAEKKDTNFFSRIWKYNIAREYYRQKEILKAKRNILESENLYVDEEDATITDHEQALSTIVDRFASEYEETLHEGEERRTLEGKSEEDIKLESDIKKLVFDYALDRISPENFEEQKNRIIACSSITDSKAAKESLIFAENIAGVAEQVKIALEHGEAIDAIDKEIKIIIGKNARVGVRTEAQYNSVDKFTEWAKGLPLSRFVNETTISLGIAGAYSAGQFFGNRFLRSKAAAWGSFGLTALVGSGVAAMRESHKLEDERRQHGREMAKGKKIDKDMQRRNELESSQYEAVHAGKSAEAIKTAVEGVRTQEQFQAAVALLAQLESRIDISDSNNIDLLTYTNGKTIEQERLDLDIARAEAKIALRKMIESGKIASSDGRSFDDSYKKVLEIQIDHLLNGARGVEGIEQKNKIFSSMKRRKVAWAAGKALATGLVIGAGVQEAAAFFNPDQEGLIEHGVKHIRGQEIKPTGHVTALEGLARYLHLDDVSAPPTRGVLTNGVIVEHALNTDIEVAQDGEITISANGEAIAEHIAVKDGELTEASKHILAVHHIKATSTFKDVVEKVPGTSHQAEVVHTPQNTINEHPGVFSQIHRKFWYDNNTTKPDQNELKLHWGGKHGTGIDEQGKYVFNVSKMTAHGSHHKHFSVNVHDALKQGKMSMLLSLSKETQFQPVEVPIDEHGNAVIDPNSDIAKMFFKQQGGQLVFIGRFAEVGQNIGPGPDGVDQYRILATDEGPGEPTVKEMKTIIDSKEGKLTKQVPVFHFERPLKQDSADWSDDSHPIIDPPPFIPLFGRRPLEPLKKADRKDIVNYGYFGISTTDRKTYESKMSKTIRENPDAELDDVKEVNDYIIRQIPDHKKLMQDLADQAGPMSDTCKLSINIPVAGHQEGKNIYATLENYLNQSASSDDFEINLFVNRPDVDEKNNPVKPDNTRDEIEWFKIKHPEIKVNVMEMVIPRDKAKIGYIRKLLNDAVLYRHHERGTANESLIMVSNDADNKGLATEYVDNFIKKFDQNKNVDAMLGQLDWDPESYVRNPLIHIGTRLFLYIDAQTKKRDKNFGSSGGNFAFRSSMYAAINGYAENKSLGEDIELGRMMKASRIGAKKHQAVIGAGARVSRLFTSSRRAEKVMKEGRSPIEQWDNSFGAFNDEVRKTEWEKIASGIDLEKPEDVKKLLVEMERVLNRTIRAMSLSSQTEIESLKRALGWLGIKYRFIGKDQIKITDGTLLIKGLKEYKKDSSKIMERKTKRAVKT